MGPWLALFALLLQSLMPIAHAAAMLSLAGPDTLVICTADGPKQVHLAEDGSLQPVEQNGKLPPACPGCKTGPTAPALPARKHIALAGTAVAAVLVPSFDPAASPASPRYPPSHPRGPPASV
jgi:hypothetical protein